MDEEEVFEDTVSVTSEPSKRDKEYISLSRFTVYHSAEDIPLEEQEEADGDKAVTAENCRLMDKPAQFSTSDAEDKIPTMSINGRSVDFVLVWEEEGSKAASSAAANAKIKREIFEKHLEEEGLILEHEKVKHLNFVKIHATHEVLCRYTEILKLRMPMKEFDGTYLEEPSFDIMQEVKSLVKRALEFVRVDPKVFKPVERKLTAEFSRDKEYLFDVDAPNFFTPAVRILVVDFILQRQKFSEDSGDLFSFGINRLITEGVYKAAYPLHDGDFRDRSCMRGLLFHEWASVQKWIKFQPVDHVKDYFGVKFGLYFAWLGFYSHMLIPASIVGLICFFYGVCTMFSNRLSQDICNESLNITMCPLCDRTCEYWNLAETCTYARITYLFDNPFTVFFAIFMSFWATLFLELWKRYSASIVHRWGLTGFDLQAEHPRPEYLARLSHVKRNKVNVVTGLEEPYVPFWKVRVPATILSFSVVLLLIALAVGAVFGVVLYRMSVLTSLSLYPNNDATGYITMFIPATAATINLICIMTLNWFYDWLAVRLTEWELLRTQTEFDDSLTLKIYLFQFVNYYTSIFYIAFLKGKFVGYPSKYNRILGYRQEECSPGGCLMELCIQLAIIMVGKQAMNSILEMVIPLLQKWYNTFKLLTGLGKEDDAKAVSSTRWAQDYRLLDWGPRGLFPEYLEMVLQYGFVTIFVAAFPLAPFFALLNNVLEMRLDAKKFLKFYRRPVPHRVKDIGVWFRILDIIGRLAVVTNAFIIAFSSNFIPRLVYMSVVNPNHTDEGFLNHSLAYFNTSDFPSHYAPRHPENVTMCRYLEYRNPPWDPHPYKRPPIYWHVLAARLAFIVVFQNVVGVVMAAVEWCIPDMSRKLRDEIRREAYLTNEIIIKQEAMRARARLSQVSSGEFLEAERKGGSGENGIRHREGQWNNLVV
ncbi:anoctamin-1-like isoform X1 [Schistocerca piceifrons]|uniref:anoctamin-1-like isoform X1 n=2 Tax=Schistocerca piceifrons TaxID=274613 RepID=UPI001F5ED856|nr:anoctamin-1-like isoform X1 [Schistocerca piceifrons]